MLRQNICRYHQHGLIVQKFSRLFSFLTGLSSHFLISGLRFFQILRNFTSGEFFNFGDENGGGEFSQISVCGGPDSVSVGLWFEIAATINIFKSCLALHLVQMLAFFTFHFSTSTPFSLSQIRSAASASCSPGFTVSETQVSGSILHEATTVFS